MLGGAVGGGVVEHDQAVDGDAGFSIDQKWIDVDRRDARAGVRHQVGEPDDRLHGGALAQRRPAAIAFQFHAGLGAMDQLLGFSRVERRPGQRDILHQFDIDATGAEQHYCAIRMPSSVVLLFSFLTRLVMSLNAFLTSAALLRFSTTPPMSDLCRMSALTTLATTGKPIFLALLTASAAVCAIASCETGMP